MSFRSRVASTVALLATAVALAPSAAAAQTTLKVGDMAPDFTVTSVTAKGVDAKPFTLSEHKGETVVLAFFPKARTSGCTVQMESYRDKYADIFKGGKKVTLVGVSPDPDSALTSWAVDAKFQFHFAADTERKVGVAYGASTGTGYHKRHLYVIDPQGRIAYIATPFNQMSADAYTDLGSAISKSVGTK
ncbi:peroxiredoxin family protein [Gemmatimonas phototrophica]|uniref:peroxiredoxin family protein n=1 Tax=Gemmatimonas phototrophica TaxID=1379270 RepID=UPI0006A6F295|nr:redoxin domain-containing protein [Gemmatimonas phototrophica]